MTSRIEDIRPQAATISGSTLRDLSVGTNPCQEIYLSEINFYQEIGLTEPAPDSDFALMKKRIENGEFDTNYSTGRRVYSFNGMTSRRPRIYENIADAPAEIAWQVRYRIDQVKMIVFQRMDSEEAVSMLYRHSGELLEIRACGPPKAPKPSPEVQLLDESWTVDPVGLYACSEPGLL